MFDKPLAFWLIQSLNSFSLGGLLFLLSAGFSLIFGLMRIANLSHGAYFMLGAAYTLQRKGHIRTDSFYGAWSPRRQGIVDAICYVVMFMPFAAIFLYFGWGYFLKAFMTSERFVSSPWMPITWPFKLAMPLTGLLLALQGISEFCKSLDAAINGRWADGMGPKGLTKELT